MVMDHVCIFFFPEYEFVLRFFGQLGWPLLCWLIVQGNKYSKDKFTYVVSIFVCAAITEPLYRLLFDCHTLNLLFSLGLGLVLLILYERKQDPRVFWLLVPLILSGAANVTVLIMFIIYFYEDDLKKLTFFSILFYFFIFMLSGKYYDLLLPVYVLFLAYPLPRLKLNKYVFYCFYPFHFLVILLIKDFF